MNSQQEKSLFEQYGWTYNHIEREWVSHDGTTKVGLDFIVKLTQEPDGDLQLMRAIVEWGRRNG